MSIAMKMLATLLVLASTSFPTPTSSLPPTVLDVNGDSLRPEKNYYILPVVRGMGGGLAISQRGVSCPLYVVQAAGEVDSGLAMSITPVNPNDEVVRISTDLNVHVSAITICMQSNVWRLEGWDEHTYVAIDGVKGNPGKETLGSWFKIEKYGKMNPTYKLVYCPKVCNTCRGKMNSTYKLGTSWARAAALADGKAATHAADDG